jgi:putative ABC transport system permease protein
MTRERSPFWYLRRHPRQRRADVDEELGFHLDMRVAELTSAGMPPDEARATALRQFGDLEYTRRYCRNQDARKEERLQWGLMRDELWHDVRHAFRKLARSPGFTLVVVLVLGLGIGANTAIFSIVNAVLIRPLPFRDPDRLVMLFESFKAAPIPQFPVSAPDLLDFQRDQQSFEGLGAYQNKQFELGAAGAPERITGARVTANLFPLLGIEPVVGRSFTSQEDAPGTGVAIISDRLWQQRFGRADVIGQTVLVNRRPHVVVGVMPAGFQFPFPGGEFNARPADLFIPMGFTPFERQGRTLMYNNSVIGRLKPGVTLEQARAELPRLIERTVEGYPPIVRKGGFELGAVLVPLREVFSGDLRTPLLVMLGAVTLVLLVACANVAGLFVSRAAAREHEMSLRVALGASQRRLQQMLLTESLVVAVTSGAFGLTLAWWGTRLLPSFLPDSIPLPGIAPDGRVLAFVLGVSILTALLSGLAPVISTRAVDLQSPIRQAAGTVTMGGRRLVIQKGLVVATVTLSVVLLVTAGLLGRSFARLMAVDPGFRSDAVLTLSLMLPAGGYPTGDQVQAFYVDLVERVRSLPSVRAAGAATDLPFVQGERRVFTPDDSPVNEPDAARSVAQTWVVGEYLQAMGIRLIRGRLFTADDRAGVERVAIVSESLARRFWPGDDAIGKRVKWGVRGGNAPWMTVVGVVADVRESRLDERAQIHTYTPYLQVPPQLVAEELTGFGMLRGLHLAVWTAGDPTLLAGPVRREIQRLDSALAIANVQTMEQQVARAAAPQRAGASVLALFAGAALLMAAVGLYGLLAYGVAQRSREIAVRMALGAEQSQVIGMVLAQGINLVVIGLALGLIAAFFASNMLETLLYEIPARDAWTFTGAPIVLLLAAVAACALPALRAARVDPVQALRLE